MGYRISPEEIEKPGITFDDTLKFIDVLKDQPIDYLHVSMSDVWRKSLTDKSITTPLNETIKQHLQGKVPMIVVGDVQTPEDAAKQRTLVLTWSLLAGKIFANRSGFKK